jgi:hypothetical protein
LFPFDIVAYRALDADVLRVMALHLRFLLRRLSYRSEH